MHSDGMWQDAERVKSSFRVQIGGVLNNLLEMLRDEIDHRLRPVADRCVVEVREHQAVEDDGIRADRVRDPRERDGRRVG